MGGLPLVPMYLILFLLPPFGAAIFCIMLDRFSVPEIKRKGYLSKLGESITESGLAERISKRGLSRLRRELASFELLERPADVLWISIPSAMVFGAVHAFLGIFDETAVIMSFMISLLPFVLLHELRKKRVERMVETMPDFLASFSAAASSGLSPSMAIKSLLPGKFGKPFASELKRMKRDLEWGRTVSEAFRRFEKRIRSGLLSRVITVMERASRATANIGDVLKILATDVSTEISLRKERRRMTSPYVMIIYMVVLMWAAIWALMVHYMLPFFPTEAIAVYGFVLGGINLEAIRQVALPALVVQAVCMGLLAGKFRTGSILDGIKHAIILSLAVWLIFLWFGA
jgi:flagellar protein FlaJ